MVSASLPSLPNEIAALRVLALDLRWTWSHEGDALWEYVDADLWRQTQNPLSVLQNASPARLRALAGDRGFRAKLTEFIGGRQMYLENEGWFASAYGQESIGGIAYLSMEFGLGAALPLYAGGLGVLAGDTLKTASDLAVPVVGVGLLYQEGYFRQIVDAEGRQRELYPYNEPEMLPIEPVLSPEDGRLRVKVELPGREIQLRVWRATVGRVALYLLDTNDPLNSPADRGITAKLYGGGVETRLMQEIVLGVGGWRVIEKLHPKIEICHINEGHAAFALVERARCCAVGKDLSFWEALWATRAGNVFTTHTPVAAGFDAFPTDLVRKYLCCFSGDASCRGVTLNDILALGRADPHDHNAAFNMAFLAQRGSAYSFGVSRLHGKVSRRIFQPLYPNWPESETPVGYITNGVHVPTWDSQEADRIWTEACGKHRWRGMPDDLNKLIASVPDKELLAMRGAGRLRLVQVVRRRLSSQLRARGADEAKVRQADNIFDPNVLTIGFARRFTEYKRPNLLLRQPERLGKLLLDQTRPIQIVIAGKAHPNDAQGHDMIGQWLAFANQPRYRPHIAFLEDYDIALAQELAQGVDVWINTPRRPWEACGTSGMKVLANGGLNCSALDGWWDEAYDEGVGWAVGDARSGPVSAIDAADAEQLYDLLENHIIPEFYARDAHGTPQAWLARIRRSVSDLTPTFGSTRMVREYLEKAYLPQAKALRARLSNDCAAAKSLHSWAENLQKRWSSLHIGAPTVDQADGQWRFSSLVLLGEVSPDYARVELFADEKGDKPAEVVEMRREEEAPGAVNGFVYAAEFPATRPAADYTLRVVPYHPEARLPAELPLIAWQR